MRPYMTWRELKEILDKLSPEELDEDVTIDVETTDEWVHPVPGQYYFADSEGGTGGHKLVLWGYQEY